MKFTLSLLTLTFISGSLLLPSEGINQQAIASEATTPVTPSIELPVTPPVEEAAISTPPETNKTLATHIVLNLKERKVYVYQDDQVLASYRVAIGKPGWETPRGEFSVFQMVENPPMEKPLEWSS